VIGVLRTLQLVGSGPDASGNRADSPSRATLAVAGVVVCGGRSARMGSDKARLLLDGRSLLERVVAEVREVVPEVVLACGPRERYGELGLPLALDEWPDGGPLAGIVAGMEAVAADRILVVACDMPRVAGALFETLIDRATREALDVCFFESERGVEPLCAVYGRRCLEPMRRALSAGRRRVRAFHEEGGELSVGYVRSTELPAELRGRDVAVNLNTPEELARETGRRRREELS